MRPTDREAAGGQDDRGRRQGARGELSRRDGARGRLRARRSCRRSRSSCASASPSLEEILLGPVRRHARARRALHARRPFLQRSAAGRSVADRVRRRAEGADRHARQPHRAAARRRLRLAPGAIALNAREISDLGAELYKRISDLGGHWVDLGRNLARTVERSTARWARSSRACSSARAGSRSSARRPSAVEIDAEREAAAFREGVAE